MESPRERLPEGESTDEFKGSGIEKYDGVGGGIQLGTMLVQTLHAGTGDLTSRVSFRSTRCCSPTVGQPV